jgi:hypothetical protein
MEVPPPQFAGLRVNLLNSNKDSLRNELIPRCENLFELDVAFSHLVATPFSSFETSERKDGGVSSLIESNLYANIKG